jgi:hypothetical protein
MTFEVLAGIITQLGPWAALCAALLWWIHRQLAKQELANEKTIRRLQTSEDWIRTTLVDMNAKMTDALADVTHAMREQAQSNRETQRTNREILHALRGRPCMHDADLPDGPRAPDTETAIERKHR